ncbi:protein GVQW3-like [Stegodyphus dumicola]|uniref:protein GVQW3-like n=1 Tax=Stegodyphus dumicola TaxID=202533 RepID=UPI0015A8FF45|nr:protein GVQW3-like [Stegodyphus dumicola]
MSDIDFEQSCVVKLCFRLKYNVKETYAKLSQAYGDNVLLGAPVFRWLKTFSEERESIVEELQKVVPVTARTDENVAKAWDCMCSGHHLTVKLIEEELNLIYTTIHQILANELGG